VTTTIAFSATVDGYIQSTAATFSSAANGTGAFTVVTNANIYWGENNNSGQFTCFEAFLDFTYTVPSNEVVTAAYLRLNSELALTTSASRALVFAEFDWGGSLTSADWRTNAQLAALPEQVCVILDAQNAGTSCMVGGTDQLVARLSSASPLRLVGRSDSLFNGTQPSADVGAAFSGADASGTADDPALIFTSAPSSRLYGVLGAQVQLSDGTHVYIESSTGDISAAPLLAHHNGTSATTIATLSGLPSCVDTDTQIFTRDGWKRYDDVRAGDEARAINPATGQAQWTSVLDVQTFGGRHFGMRLEGDGFSALATVHHRWLVRRDDTWMWVTTEHLGAGDEIPTEDGSVRLDDLSVTEVAISGTVWCPTTGLGNWLARRGSSVFYTGNKP
jgi:hypothetical protein